MSVLLNKVCVCRYLSSILCPDSNDITLLPADGTSSTGGSGRGEVSSPASRRKDGKAPHTSGTCWIEGRGGGAVLFC